MSDFQSVEDLVTNRSFRQWVIENDPQAAQQWKKYLRTHPQKAALVDEARLFLQTLSGTTYQVSDQQVLATWQRIESEVMDYSSVDPTPKKQRHLYRNYYYVAASFMAVVLMAAFWFFGRTNATQTYQTAYGEIQQWVLPDSSVVTLNANSSLIFNPIAFKQHRKVHIAGEAYFTIRKRYNEAQERIPFIVQTDALAVEVLGTEFNVNTRRSQTQVVLTEGKVKVSIPENTAQEAIYMQPGEMVTYVPGQTAQKAIVNPTIHNAWQRNELVFEDTSVEEIIQLLEDTYGLEILLQRPEVANRKYTGTFRSPKPNTILMALQAVFALKMERDGDKITLK